MPLMFPLTSASPLKRQRSLPPDQASDPSTDILPAKKQRKDDCQAEWVPSERYWDTLPKIHLTRQALTELNRRNRRQKSAVVHERSLKLPRRSVRLQRSAFEKQEQRQKQVLGSFSHSNLSPGLKRFARRGGPDLTTIRGFPDPTMSDQTSRFSRQTTTSGQTASSKRSGPYDRNYELKLNQAGIFTTTQRDHNNRRIKPDNYDEIIDRLKQRRSSLSPSRFTERQFEDFQDRNERDILEKGTMSKSMAIIEGTNDHFSLMGSKFNNVEPFDDELAMAVPDSYDGAPPLSIDHRVLNQLDAYIVPSTNTIRPALPNFFLEAKSTQGRADVGKVQAAHSGAHGARAMQMVQSYPSMVPVMYDNNAYSFTNTYHDGQLKMYMSHITAPKTSEDRPQYHLTQLETFAMTGNRWKFIEGATFYRNARDLAKEQRDSFIQQANQKAQQLPSVRKHSQRSYRRQRSQRSRATTRTVSVSTNFQDDDEYETSLDTDTSVDELALDKVLKRSRHLIMDDDDTEADASQTNLAMSTPASDQDASSQQSSQPAVRNATLRRARDLTPPPGRMSFTMSSTSASTTPRINITGRTEQSRDFRVASPDPLTHNANPMSFIASSDRAPTRLQTSSNKIDTSKLTEVQTKRARKKGVMGRVYTALERQIFVPDDEWETVKKGGHDAWVNRERRVFYLDASMEQE